MNVLLLSTNRNTLPMPVMPIGACLVAEAAQRAGHQVRLLDLMFLADPLGAVESAIRDFRPEAVGLSVRNIDNNDMGDPVFYLDELRRIVSTIRGCCEAPIILGGAALGVMPEAMLRLVPATCAVVGDGETVFPELLGRLARGEAIADLPGVALVEDGGFRRTPPDLTRFSPRCPSPDYRRWLDLGAYRRQLATVPIQTKTGCQFRCVYCTYPGIEGSSCNLKDPESVADAVARLAASGLRDIEIVDSVFNAPLDHAMEICAALARGSAAARLQCLELNPRHFNDELLGAMEQAGFRGMGITLESAADPVLAGLNKGFTSREVHRAAEAVRRHRIPCAWIFLFGGPGETEQTVLETLRFAKTQIRPGDIAFFNTGIRVYPGTELETIARRQGVLSRPAAEMLEPTFYLSPQVDARWIRQQLKQALADHMNFIDMGSLSLPFLPSLHRIGAGIGLRPPLWRYTRFIRRGLRLAGMDV
ncbi:B12-binding domain-containing radical SAM protein [Desulfuromonas versatilis]|uniref:B12-binding domain-containing radical SAM protein n=1 Tax=Desulfuromonas versatilis TaxID=2802975 RepID=A0ABM8HR16_9BACT|nr:radical SAM protein [Desulfuromonas versatilis]BCR04335.1 B12-binding domain-containing radical SAM protein [Desulfuromonas versatilis]